MDESIEHWEDFAWLDLCTRSVQTLAVAAGLLDAQLGVAVGFDRQNAHPHLIGLLGSRDVLSLVVFEAAGIARSLHSAARGKLPLPAAAAAPAGSSSTSRRSQVHQQQQQAVPASHDLLFEAIDGRPLLSCVNLDHADSQWHPPPPALQRRALGCVKGLRLLLLGQAADPGPDPKCFSTGGIDLGGFADMVTAMAALAPLDTWPPAATFPPERQQQLVGTLMQVVVELLLLVPEDPDGKQGALLEGLELLHHLAGLQQHSAPGLVAMVEPVLLLLGPAVTHAVKQQQQGAASSAWAVEAWQGYGLLLARLLRSGEWLGASGRLQVGSVHSRMPDCHSQQLNSLERGFSCCPCRPHPLAVCRLLYACPVPPNSAVDIEQHAAPVFAKQPAAAAICEAALRAQLLDAAPASRRQPGRLMADKELTLLAGQLAGLVGTTTVAVAEASVAAASASRGPGRGGASSNNSSVVVLPPALLCLLVSCLKVTSRVGVAACGALLAASQAASVLATAVMLCPQQVRGEGEASSTAAASLRQLLENGSLSWAVLAARVVFCTGQALAQLPQDIDVTSSLQQQVAHLPVLLQLCERALEILGWQLTQLQSQLPAAEVNRWLPTAAAVILVVAAARPAAAAGSSSSSDAASLAALGRELQALGRQEATLLPSPHVCNNPACVTISAPGAAAAGVSGLSEKALLAKGRCSGCQLSRYCSKSCLAAHWKEGHKAVCKLLQAGGGGAS
jgi:hypothetical protein